MDNLPLKQLQIAGKLQNYVLKSLENYGRNEDRWIIVPEKQESVQDEVHNCYSLLFNEDISKFWGAIKDLATSD